MSCSDVVFFFFFSSRRRHTRCSRDWSSDVCSSDLCSRQAVRQRLVEHVVSHLPGRIARADGIVKECDIELPKTGLVVGVHGSRSASAILLTVKREIVLVYTYCEFRWWVVGGLLVNR